MNTKMQDFIAISDLISLMNMSSGFISILLSINHNFHLAATLMIFSLLFDSIDGWVARKINRNDEYGFGKNIDSLSDIISFGVAPAIFLYISTTINNRELIILSCIVSLFIIICGVLRLTRYNVISGETEGFIGFPIPGIAIIIATLYLSGLYNTYLSLIIAVIVSISMICDKTYDKFNNKYLLILNGICLVLIILQIPIKIYGINIPALIVFLTSVFYLTVNLIH